MLQVLTEFPNHEFLNDGYLRLYTGSGVYYLAPNHFNILGAEIGADAYKLDPFFLIPPSKKKTIKLFRYFYKSEDGIHSSCFTSMTFNQVCDISHVCLELLKTEEKEIEVDDL